MEYIHIILLWNTFAFEQVLTPMLTDCYFFMYVHVITCRGCKIHFQHLFLYVCSRHWSKYMQLQLVSNNHFMTGLIEYPTFISARSILHELQDRNIS